MTAAAADGVGGRPGTTAGLLLAAGEGRRLGTPKALVELDGRPLVLRALDVLADGGAHHPILLVVGSAAGAVEAVAGGSPHPVVVVRNDRWAEGMGSSVRAGLAAAAATDAEALVVGLVDQPGIGADVVRRLLDRRSQPDRPAAVTATFAGDQRTPVVLAREVWAEVAASAVGDRGARAWLRANPDRVVVVACDDLADPADLDTPDDLAAWRAAGR